ncbi:MAG: hypothetical protein WB795_07585 [Candidatus Acidiferrales bacterium]
MDATRQVIVIGAGITGSPARSASSKPAFRSCCSKLLAHLAA